MGYEKIDQKDIYAYMGSITSKDGGSSEDTKSRICLFTLQKSGRIGRYFFEPWIRLLQARVMKGLKHVGNLNERREFFTFFLD